MIPQTEPAKRIARLYHRKPTTPWSSKEIAAYKKLVKDGCFNDLSDLELVELYYQTEKKKERGFHRRDLQTFLNNFRGELDRARAWRETIKIKPRGYGNFLSSREQGNATDDDFKRASAEAKRMIESLRAKLSPVPEVKETPVDTERKQ